MGQQQLLLLVLGVVIVGLAVVVGIEAFNERKRASEIDRYTEMGVALAGDIIAFYQKPVAHGGAGERAAHLASLTSDDLGYPSDVQDSWAGYDRTGITANGVVRYVVGDDAHPFLHIHDWPLQTGSTRVEVHVYGPSADCIVSRTSRYNESGWSDGSTSDGSDPGNPNAAACSW